MKELCYEVQTKYDLESEPEWHTWESNLDSLKDVTKSIQMARDYYKSHLIDTRVIEIRFKVLVST
jgi:hypothetical protein